MRAVPCEVAEPTEGVLTAFANAEAILKKLLFLRGFVVILGVIEC